VQRNRATVGGAVATAAPNDPLLAALLACGAQVALLNRAGPALYLLRDFLARRMELLSAPAIIADVIVPWPAQSDAGALAQVGRTPADTPIVVAAATVCRDGNLCCAARLALGGVAAAPLDLSDAASALNGQSPTDTSIATCVAQAIAGLHPTGDFLGSAEYRRVMAEVLSARALRMAWEQAA
jgi:carbon-monoxide dehydrogenase medium subunit